MTAFIDSFATQQLLPPWVSPGAQSWIFAVAFQSSVASAYLGKYFNGGFPDRAPFDYSPLPGAQHGLLCAIHHPRISSVAPGRWDTLSHTEVYWAYPVLRRAITADRLLVDPHVVWVQTLLLDDNPSVVFSAREIWGSDAAVASIVRQEGPAPHRLHLDAGLMSVKRFSARSTSELLPVLHVKAEGGRRISDPSQLGRSGPQLAQFASILGAGAEPAGGRNDGASDGLLLNNLKQIRDALHREAAVYRAIVESRTTHTGVDNLVVYEGGEVELDFMWSAAIAEMLTESFGLRMPTAKGPPSDHASKSQRVAPGQMDWGLDRARMPVEFGCSFTSNVAFEVLRTLHTYGG